MSPNGHVAATDSVNFKMIAIQCHPCSCLCQRSSLRNQIRLRSYRFYVAWPVGGDQPCCLIFNENALHPVYLELSFVNIICPRAELCRVSDIDAHKVWQNPS